MEEICNCKNENKVIEISKINLLEDRVKKIRDSANGLLGYISMTKKRKESISLLKIKCEREDQEQRINNLERQLSEVLKLVLDK